MGLSGFTRVLRWTDFTEVKTSRVPPNDAETHAKIASKSFSIVQNKAKKYVIKASTWQVSVTIDTKASWVVKGKKDATLLKHEQGHYDIAALTARQFHDEALALEADSPKELSEAVEKLMQDLSSEGQAIQDMYDEDITCGSAHGTHSIFQTSWSIRIKAATVSSTGRLVDLSTCPAP